MKNSIFITLTALSITACSSVATHQDQHQAFGMANPASQYCIEHGGKLEIVQEANGEVGYCHLANGEKVEEWALFRQNQKQCAPNDAKALIGQANLTDDQIKQSTKSEIVRRVGPNQAVTMDYRSERVTVVIDPKTQKITQASCG